MNSGAVAQADGQRSLGEPGAGGSPACACGVVFTQCVIFLGPDFLSCIRTCSRAQSYAGGGGGALEKEVLAASDDVRHGGLPVSRVPFNTNTHSSTWLSTAVQRL